jgi:hypothetical protein
VVPKAGEVVEPDPEVAETATVADVPLRLIVTVPSVPEEAISNAPP